jgi:hypothetical protein
MANAFGREVGTASATDDQHRVVGKLAHALADTFKVAVVARAADDYANGLLRR